MHLAREYAKNSVMTSDGLGIVILLYEGIINFNNMSKVAIEASDIESRTKYINKSIAIIGELSNALDMEVGGIISQNLNRLYSYMMEELVKANLNNDPAPINLVNKLVIELKGGWEGIRDKKSSNEGVTAQAGEFSVRL